MLGLNLSLSSNRPPPFNPSGLFRGGEAGVWYDPSDFSTLFQDTAGTTPVTAVEQPVGLMLDKSGNGNHATQPTATSRPVLKQDGNGKHYLYFDGADDWMVTNTITPGTDKVQVFAGVRKLRDGIRGAIVELFSGSPGATGGFGLSASGSGDEATYRVFSGGSTIIGKDASGFAAPITNVLTGIGDISGNSAILRVNGTQATSSTAGQGTGNYLAYPLTIGSRSGSTLLFNGHLYSLIVRFGSNLPVETIERVERFVNRKTRAY